MSESKSDDSVRYWWLEFLKRFLVSQFSSALCGGEKHRSYLQSLGMPPEKIFTGYDAVDNSYFSTKAEVARQQPDEYQSLPGLDSFDNYFLASARFIPRKNIAGLLRAYNHYRKMVIKTGLEPWRLVILGDGIERQNLKSMIQELKISGVTFAGFRQIGDLPAYYGLARVFIHPPHQEQWGLVVNEAMASGLPVIVSHQSGCASELVVEGQTGFTFDSNNVNDLASLMIYVMSGEVDLANMGKAAQNLIKRWAPEYFASGLYSAIIVS